MDKVDEEIRKKILDMIVNYIGEHGYPPTVKEMSETTRIGKTTVYRNLDIMLAKGILDTDAERLAHRAIRVPGYKFVKSK